MYECSILGCTFPPGHGGRHSNQPVEEIPHTDCAIAVTVMGDPEYPKGKIEHCVLPAGHTGDHSNVKPSLADVVQGTPAGQQAVETALVAAAETQEAMSAAAEPEPIVTPQASDANFSEPAPGLDFAADDEADNPERAFGRPTKFREEYTEQMLQFFRKDPVEKIETVTSGSNGKGSEWSKTEVRYEALTFPTLELFADSLDVNVSTLAYWAGRYPSNFTEVGKQGQLRNPDFSRAYTRIKDLQRGHLLQHALTGKLNSGFAQFFAINNLGMQSKSVVEEKVTHTYEDMTDEQLIAATKARANRAT